MRTRWTIFLQTMIASLVGLAVMYAQKRIGGPVGGIIPGILGYLIGWLVTAAMPADIERLRRWLLRRRAIRHTQHAPK